MVTKINLRNCTIHGFKTKSGKGTTPSAIVLTLSCEAFGAVASKLVGLIGATAQVSIDANLMPPTIDMFAPDAQPALKDDYDDGEPEEEEDEDVEIQEEAHAEAGSGAAV